MHSVKHWRTSSSYNLNASNTKEGGVQWCIQDFCEGGAGRGGPSQGEGAGGGCVREEAFEDILYLVYEASWFHVHHAVAAFKKYIIIIYIAVSTTNIIII